MNNARKKRTEDGITIEKEREREKIHKYAINESKNSQIMIQRKCKNYAFIMQYFL